MNRFVLVSLVLAVTGEFLAQAGLPRILAYAPELCSMAAAVILVIHLARHGVPQLRTAYIVVLTLIGLHILFGLIANQVQVGTVIIGSRLYLRAIPFFLLAIAAPPNSNELSRLLVAIGALGVVQLPLAVNQRLATMARDSTNAKFLTTGDWTVGTFINAAMLSIFLISIAAIVFAALLRNKLRPAIAIPLLAVLLIPTMINETKATLFLIPLVVFAISVAHPSGKRRRSITIAFVSITVFTVAFIPTYDYFMKPRWGYGIIDFFAMEGRVENYLDKGGEVGTTEKVGRIDALKLPIETLGKDPVALTLGLGMGNVTESVFGESYSGKYFAKYGNLPGPTVSRLIWELGLLGVVLVFGLMFLIFKHAIALRHRNDAIGIIAHAWTGVIPLFIIGMFYKELMFSPGLSVFFWYICGLIVAHSGDLVESAALRRRYQSADNSPAYGAHT